MITTVASAAAAPYIVAGIVIGIVASLGINAAINAYNNYQANKQQGTVVTDEVDAYSKTAEDNIDIIPQGNIQTPTIEAPYAEPKDDTTIEVIPGGDVLAPKLLKPWETIPALTPQEPTILMSSGTNYENGVSYAKSSESSAYKGGSSTSKTSRKQAFRQAKEAAGIPESAQYKTHKFVYDGTSENRIVYEFEINGERKYIIEHPFDKMGRGNHFHGADASKGSPFDKGRYNQYDGHFPEDFDGFY